MTLTDRQAHVLEMEFLQQDLGRLPTEMPVTTIKRELTRSLFEHPDASPRDVVGSVVRCLDQVVTAWEGERSVTSKAQPQVVDGVRAAATIITEAAERAGLTMPVQPTPAAPYDAEEPLDADGNPIAAAEWTPSDGGLTPSMFGGI